MAEIDVTISNHAWYCIGFVLIHHPHYREIKGFYKAKEIYKKWNIRHGSTYQNNVNQWMDFMSLVETNIIDSKEASLLWELLQESKTFEGIKPPKEQVKPQQLKLL